MIELPRRILVTGSRDWTDEARIRHVLEFFLPSVEMSPYIEPDYLLVSGACPTGADAIAEQIWSEHGWPIERHPADWKRYGYIAGPLRNKLMVDLGAWICLAFIRKGSRGATHTAALAEKAGIEVHRFLED